jgi:hypothetical protein
MFGPPEPMITALISNPEFAERKLKAKFGSAMDHVLEREMGAKLDKAARLDAIRKLIAKLDANDLMESEQGQKKEESSNSNFVSMFASVKLPGRIVESNGETDEVTGEVYWSLMPDAAQLGDVTLRAVCEVTP